MITQSTIFWITRLDGIKGILFIFLLSFVFFVIAYTIATECI